MNPGEGREVSSAYPLDGRLRFWERGGAMAKAAELTALTGLIWQTEYDPSLARFRVVLSSWSLAEVTPTGRPTEALP